MLPIDALKKVPIFEELEDSLLRLLSVRSRETTVSEGDRLMTEGEAGTSLHILLEGRVSVHQKISDGTEVQIAERCAGDCFGEMSLIDGKQRSATVVALEPCKVLVVSQDTFNQIILSHPRAALAVMHTLIRRLRELSAELAAAKNANLAGHP